MLPMAYSVPSFPNTASRSPPIVAGVEGQAHPQRALLLRFLRGEATLAEKHSVVRHLLAGCPQCAAAVLPIWGPQQDRRPRRELEG
jgi:hypothetical protein